jgi:iron complex outermembrane receptor protein
LYVLLSAARAAAADTAIEGTVRDPTGAVLPGVSVMATSLRTHRTATVVSDGAGAYRFERVEPGDYQVRAELPGFQAAEADLHVAEDETATADLTLTLAPVAETVTVTRTDESLSIVPNAVAVVTGHDIQLAQRRVSPAEALAGVPGLLAENRHNFSLSGGVRLAIRSPLPALGMRGVQVVQDGIPLTTADGTTQPTNLTLGSTGRAEIVRGPSSVLYGNSAGGVVSLTTEFPPSGHLTIDPDAQVGSYGYQRQEMKGGGAFGGVQYLVDASRMQTDGYRTHSAADVRQANVTIHAPLSPATDVRGVFNLFDMPFGESASTLNRADALLRPRSVRQLAIDQGWGESSQQGQGGVTLVHQFTGGSRLRATGWAMWRNTLNPIPSRVIDVGRDGAGARSEFRAETHIGPVPAAWTAGFDLSYQRDDRHEFENAGVAAPGERTREGRLLLNQLEEVLSAAPFGQVSLSLRPRLHATVGVRYDHYRFSAADRFLSDGNQSGDRGLDAASPKLGLTWTATQNVNVYTSFSTAYQTPTTVELSNRPTGEGGFNEDLQPATLKSFEVGVRGLMGRWRLRYELAAYVSALDDAFVSLQRPDEQTYFLNAGRSTRDGIEVLLEWSAVPSSRTRLAYTYQDFRFDRFATAQADYSGKREPGAPPHQLFVSETWQAPFGLLAAGQLRWLDAYPVDNANTAFDWSSRVVDLRFALDRKWKGVSLRPFVGFDNVFDERYNASVTPNAVAARYYEPAPDREVYVGLTVGAGLF